MTKKEERIEKLIRKRKEEFAKRVKEMELEERKKTKEDTPHKEETCSYNKIYIDNTLKIAVFIEKIESLIKLTDLANNRPST